MREGFWRYVITGMILSLGVDLILGWSGVEIPFWAGLSIPFAIFLSYLIGESTTRDGLE